MTGKTYKLCILRNEWPDHHLEWLAAVAAYGEGVQADVVDITRQDWLERALACDYDLYLLRPSDRVSYFKQLYDERVYILHHVLGKRIYPSYEEVMVYENKKFLAYWLAANRVPHARTNVFYHKEEALAFAHDCPLPVVGKSAIGAAGSGVKILRRRSQLLRYLDRVFSKKGIKRRWGPNLRKGNMQKRAAARLRDIRGLIAYFKRKFRAADSDPHRWFAILQEFIPATFEWRAVRVGESFFAHKKIAPDGGLFSGTSQVNWDGPSPALLDFVEQVTDKRGFLSQAVDIFETDDGRFLVNELQCFFGSQNPHQMILDGVPGRYIRREGQWVFEAGEFNVNNSFNLRLRHALALLEAERSGFAPGTTLSMGVK